MSEPSRAEESFVEHFEDAWQAGRPPEIGAFLRAAVDKTVPPLDPIARRVLMIRLIRIDLEYRWRAWDSRGGGGLAWCLEEYARHVPAIGGRDQWPAELIVAEYRNRCLWGDRPEINEFLAPFAGRRDELLPRLRQAETAIAALGASGDLTALHHDPLQATNTSRARALSQGPENCQTSPDSRSIGRDQDPREHTQADTDHPGNMVDTAGPSDTSSAPTENFDGGSRRFPAMPATVPVERDRSAEDTSQGWDRSDDTLSLGASGKSRRGHRRPSAGLGTFGAFELLEEIGRGGMGIVYKAREIELNRVVALKMILADESSSQTALQRFRIEAEIAGRLDHPNIVPVFQVGHHAGRHFYAMGFIDGSTLAHRVTAGPLPQAEAVELVWHIAEAVAYAHSRGIIHRDLKPGNILIDSQGLPKVADFGLAKVVATESALTLTGEILGTPSFMAPEQAGGRTHEIGEPADIYSLGAILYCLLTGRPPFQGPSTLETLSQVMHNDPVPPRRLQPKTDRDVETICLKCLAKSAGQRYATAQELVDDLRRFLDQEPIHARPPSLSYRLEKFVRRHRAEASTLSSSLAAFLVIMLLATWYYQSAQTRRMNRLIAEGREQLTKAIAAPGVESDPLFEGALLNFNRAQELRPNSVLPASALMEAYLRRCQKSLDEGEFEAARASLLTLRSLDRDRRFATAIADLERKTAGTSRLRIESTPTGAVVQYSVLDGDARPGPSVQLGVTPVAEQDFMPGNCRFTFIHPDRPEVRLPVLIGRSETRSIETTLPKADEIPPGMVYVPAGPFLFGDPQFGTPRVVSIPGFFIDRTEVTGADYEKFLAATSFPPPDQWMNYRTCPPVLREAPVFNVSWFAAYAYARWAGKRLPTELEWEKAARGVDGRPYPWGTRYDVARAASRDAPSPDGLLVGKRPAGASPYGCLDMAGNVWEWTIDRERAGVTDRVIRGGSGSSIRDELLTFRRKSAPPGGSDFGAPHLLGFRCVKALIGEAPSPEIPDALVTGPDFAEAAEFYFAARRWDLIRQCCHRILPRNPRSVDGNFWMAVCLHNEGRHSDALDCLRTVYFQKPNYSAHDPSLRGVKAQINDMLGHLSERGPVDSSFLEAEKWFADAHQALDAARYDEAEKLLRRVLDWDPENDVAHEQMAMIKDARNDAAAAKSHRLRRIEGYRRSFKEDTDNADMRDQFAEFLLHNNLLLPEAREHARTATELAPTVARYRRIFAECLAQQSEWDAALAQIQLAIQLDPEDNEARTLLAEYQERASAGTHG